MIKYLPRLIAFFLIASFTLYGSLKSFYNNKITIESFTYEVKPNSSILDAGISTNDIDYINAHATSTPLGDLAECNAIKSIFDSPPPISSTKSMTGHTLGAAGAVESIFSILSIVNNISPPTINLNNPDEGCDLDFIPKEARDMKIDVSLNNSFGFGGTNSTLIFKSV